MQRSLVNSFEFLFGHLSAPEFKLPLTFPTWSVFLPRRSAQRSQEAHGGAEGPAGREDGGAGAGDEKKIGYLNKSISHKNQKYLGSDLKQAIRNSKI